MRDDNKTLTSPCTTPFKILLSFSDYSLIGKFIFRQVYYVTVYKNKVNTGQFSLATSGLILHISIAAFLVTLKVFGLGRGGSPLPSSCRRATPSLLDLGSYALGLVLHV